MGPENLRILQVHSFNRIHAVAGIVTSRKNRDAFGLMLKTQGKTTYRFHDGTTLISDPTHLCLLPKGSSYAWQTTEGICYNIEFDLWQTDVRPAVFAVKDSAEAIHLFLKLEQSINSTDRSAQLRAISDLYSIFLLITEKSASPAATGQEQRIAKALEKMRHSYADADLTMAQIAQASGISEVYFRRIYTRIYGSSPMQGLTALRMKKAEELLSSDYNSVSAIAEAVGYKSIYHFSKAFKQYFGVSPTQYQPSK